jgi:hypothetical protein
MVLNLLMDITAGGGGIGIPGLYVTGDPGGVDDAAKRGALSLSLGAGSPRRASPAGKSINQIGGLPVSQGSPAPARYLQVKRSRPARTGCG